MNHKISEVSIVFPKKVILDRASLKQGTIFRYNHTTREDLDQQVYISTTSNVLDGELADMCIGGIMSGHIVAALHNVNVEILNLEATVA
jgi:hypothetical protein